MDTGAIERIQSRGSPSHLCSRIYQIRPPGHTTKFRKSAAVYHLCHRCHVKEIVQVLNQIDPKHPFQIIGPAAALSFIIVRLDECYPLSPRNDALYLCKKFFYASLHSPIHRWMRTLSTAYPYPDYIIFSAVLLMFFLCGIALAFARIHLTHILPIAFGSMVPLPLFIAAFLNGEGVKEPLPQLLPV